MINCHDCEHYHESPSGEQLFTCDPFGVVKESDCLAKWQIIKLNQMIASYQATLDYYRKLSPLQEKMFRVMEREIDDMNESDKWKADDPDDPDDLGDDWDDDSRRR